MYVRTYVHGGVYCCTGNVRTNNSQRRRDRQVYTIARSGVAFFPFDSESFKIAKGDLIDENYYTVLHKLEKGELG